MDKFLLGQPLRLSTTVTDPTTGNPVDPGSISLVVVKPDLTQQTLTTGTNPAIVRDDVGVFHLSYTPATLGTYQTEWVTTGNGAGVSTDSFTVYDPLGTPDLEAWRPSRTDVAKYVPERTLAADQTSDTPLNDFTTATTPTAMQADGHIDDAVSWVQVRTGTLDPTMYGEASAVAAIRAAGMIELSFPVRDADINTAAALLGQADLMIERLVVANEAAAPLTSAPGVLSAWQFPDPVPWGDTLEIWS